MKRKADIDEETARLLDLPVTMVTMVTGCFLRTLLHQIVDTREVLIDGFGKFLLKEQRNVAVAHLEKGTFKKGGRRGRMVIQTRRKFRVWFKKSTRFRTALEDAYGDSTMGQHNEEAFEKYGVDESSGGGALEKNASENCPECGQRAVRHGAVLACPKHGTEPFEVRR